jgi:hypothetical protein
LFQITVPFLYSKALPKLLMVFFSQTDINVKMRAILIDWLVEVHLKFKVSRGAGKVTSGRNHADVPQRASTTGLYTFVMHPVPSQISFIHQSWWTRCGVTIAHTIHVSAASV